MTHDFHGDRPIGVPRDDRFGLAVIAERVASAIREQSAGNGLVLGIEGAWGSGKSSLIALIVKLLKGGDGDSVAIVDFAPWLVGDRDQLLVSLFEELSRSIDAIAQAGGDSTGVTVAAARSAADQLRRYATYLGPAGKLVGVAGLALPGMGVAGKIMEGLAAAAAQNVEGPSLSSRKAAIEKALSELERRIVVVVDDVDRLDPLEVAELLRLVRSVADFPNVTYLLCYDGERLARAVTSAVGVDDGRAYLEKIVQLELTIPRPETFALRRMFSDGLATFAACDGERGQRLAHVIDRLGGRFFKTPRVVNRVLDALRFYWPAIKGQVDLADLVWLRILAAGAPATYRWVEEYVDVCAAVATGRATVDSEERTEFGRRLDVALEADGLSWEATRRELHLVLPAMGWSAGNEQRGDGRIFNNAGQESGTAARRLASPDHARLYFALARLPGSVDLADIDALLSAAQKSREAANGVLAAMAEERGPTGDSKAERMLDQLRNLPSERLANTDPINLSFAVVDVADRLVGAADEEWGQPRPWLYGKQVLASIGRAVGAEQWLRLTDELFTRAPQIGFLTHVLRDDTFDHGVYGDRADPGDATGDREQFNMMREAMFERYRALGIDGLLGLARPASALYAWSQAGGRDEVVALVAQRTEGDDSALVHFLTTLTGTSSLDPEGVACFFDDVPTVLQRLRDLADAGDAGAARVIAAISSSLRFRNVSIAAWIEARRAAETASDSDDGAEA